MRGLSAVQACRSCGAAIRWARSAGGRPIPLDAVPNRDGSVAMVDGRAVVAAKAGEAAEGEAAPLRWMPHHATCPHGRAWRTGRAG